MKQNLIEWVNNPFTAKYAEFLRECQDELKEKLTESIINNFSDQRNDQERLIQSQIIALGITIKDLEGFEEFRLFCLKNGIELDQAEDEYILNEKGELKSVEEKEHSRLKNPINSFINKLNNNEN